MKKIILFSIVFTFIITSTSYCKIKYSIGPSFLSGISKLEIIQNTLPNSYQVNQYNVDFKLGLRIKAQLSDRLLFVAGIDRNYLNMELSSINAVAKTRLAFSNLPIGVEYCFIKGRKNISYFAELGVSIWYPESQWRLSLKNVFTYSSDITINSNLQFAPYVGSFVNIKLDARLSLNAGLQYIYGNQTIYYEKSNFSAPGQPETILEIARTESKLAAKIGLTFKL